ncbi:hypothetical protein BDV97DRAFT_344781 [Delphinella strobiligena]|nr:hypothetical protein BDV97DRAFT_344781 [Delphinella strobiligena]
MQGTYPCASDSVSSYYYSNLNIVAFVRSLSGYLVAAMIPWSTIQSLLIFFGPIILPRALAFYRSLRAPSNTPPQSLSPKASRALNILFVSAINAFVSTLPYFTPSNIFLQTQSRLQTPTNVLFTRLNALHTLTPVEQGLRDVFEAGGLEARLLYLRYGQDVVATSAHLVADPKVGHASTAYLIYALPSLLAPHLFHLGILGLVTSSGFAGREAARWRTLAVIAGSVLMAADFGLLATYDHTVNARAVRSTDVDGFFWKRRLICRLLVCFVDGVLGWIIYLTATKRAFVEPAPPAERIEDTTRQVEVMLGRLKGLGAIRNVVFRDTMLRSSLERYWVNEQEVMRAVFEDREVVGALNEVLGNVDMGAVEGEANGYVEGILGNVRVVPPSG